MKAYLLILAVLLAGCSTVARRDNGETISIRGIGKAEWPDGVKIEGRPMITLPTIPILR